VTALLIAGHGSSDEAGAEQFRALTERVGKRLDVPVAGGFIELSAPPNSPTRSPRSSGWVTTASRPCRSCLSPRVTRRATFPRR
jgi:sirohydrochlorin ferrochelatase